MVGKYVVSILFLVSSFTAFGYIMHSKRKLKAFILEILWAIGNYYFIVFFSEIFYLENPEDISRFWFKFYKFAVHSDYHYYIITHFMIWFISSVRYSDDLIIIINIQIIYFFLDLSQKSTEMQLYWILSETTMVIYLIFKECRDKVWASTNFLLSSIIGASCYMFYDSFASIWPILFEYIYTGIIILIVSYCYFYFQLTLHSYLLHGYTIAFISNRYAKTWLLDVPFCIVLALPFTCIFAFIYDIFIGYLAGSNLNILKIPRDLFYTFPFALILSLHHCSQDLKYFFLNFVTLYFEMCAVVYFIFI